MSKWINFKELRAKLDFEKVLRHYGVEIKRKGDQHLGFCPLPNHQGNKTSPSFSANLKRGIFQCFGCGTKGNVLEFAAYMEKLNLKDGSALRELALRLEERFCPGTEDRPKAAELPLAAAAERSAPAPKESGATVLVNEPLDFELKGLDPDQPYLVNRGFTPATIRHFGLGFCTRGMLKDRVAIPLRDQEGRLIGYAGRVINDAAVTEDNPRYRFPGTRKRDGKVFEFRKSLFLYNGFAIQAPAEDLILVEGFASVWWLHQNGLPNAVATMGSDCSEQQVDLMVTMLKAAGRLWFLPDGDAAGERFAQSFLPRIALLRFVRWVKLEKDQQPTDLSAAELKSFFAN
jgi:DNA primase